VPVADTASPLSDADAAALFADLTDSAGLIAAVSGGPDSTALLVLLARWRRQLARPPKLLTVTIDHGLRLEARAEANAVKRLARHLDVPHKTVRWRGTKPTTGLQEAARMTRYRLLAQAACAARASHVLTAHTQDDQAETVLFRMARGSGLSGLSGMARSAPLPACVAAKSVGARRSIALVRPFLHIPKARLIATLRARGITFAEDPSNRDPRFTRPRLREVMPILAAEGLNAQRFDVLAHRLRRADEALNHMTNQLMERHFRDRGQKSGVVVADWPAMRDYPAELGMRALRRAIEHAGEEGFAELRKLEALWVALQEAARAGRRIRRTLAGAVVTLSGQIMTVESAPPRRRRAPLTAP
jgi:tRNA(Ile)-lysidine synthase